MREASRDKATPLEEGGRKDNRDRCQSPFGKVSGVANRSDCLDGIDRALAYSLHDDHSQTTWLGDAICTRHRNAQRAFLLAIRLWDVHSLDRHRFKHLGFECLLETLDVAIEVSEEVRFRLIVNPCRSASLIAEDFAGGHS